MKKRFKPSLTTRLVKLVSAGGACALLAFFFLSNRFGSGASAQVAQDAPRALAALSAASVPEPANLSTYVANKSAAIALGKALFWDMQVGSDGIQSCASCHFHAGADNRSKNQLNPGCPDCPPTTDGYGFGGPNHQSQTGDYPFHQLTDPANRFSTVVRDRNEVTSSQGVFRTDFLDIVANRAEDNTQHVFDPVFNVGGTNTRRVEPRNTPTVINAVFNHRNFWDGRAHNEFNGINPFGDSDVNARVLSNGLLGMSPVRVSIRNASLASQAVGPVLSDFEMSGARRSFPKVGKKLLSMKPLAKQAVATDDSVLGTYRNSQTGKGLNQTYLQMVQAAFRSEWWNNSWQRVSVNANGSPVVGTSGEFTQAEYNFSLFFGLAVQLYEATLVSDQSPFDKFARGDNNALSANQKLGKAIFEGKGKCIVCHNGPEFTGAAIGDAGVNKTELMVMGNGANATYDTGFYNIGVRPTAEDKGLGNQDPFGRPLSFSRATASGRVAVDGAFKTPGLRNVELTAPYFHNGGSLTLNHVVEFYNRGGDFHEANFDNLDADIENLGLTTAEQAALVDFMKSLTDERVRYHQAPFDHPELIITNGHPGDTKSVTGAGNGKAVDSFITLPAIGKLGSGSNQTVTTTETRYRSTTKWGIIGYILFVPIYGWVTTQEPYQVQVTQTVWVPRAPTLPFLAPPVAQASNLSLNRTAKQSSDFGTANLASKAVDGNASGNGSTLVSHTQSEANPWWQVDLGASKTLDYLKIYNRTDCCADRLANYYVFVSDTDLTGRTYANIVGDLTVKRFWVSGTSPAIHQLALNTTGRYVRIQLSGSNYLSLGEVEAWGK